MVGLIGGWMGARLALLAVKARVLALETEMAHVADSHVREVRKRASDARWGKNEVPGPPPRPPESPEEIQAWFERGGR